MAAAASCHMLFFLHYAADAGLEVESYSDNAVGTIEKLANGRVGLHPDIVFAGGSIPDEKLIRDLHHRAHESCFIANTLNCPVVVADE